ncbi:MAG: hypothetical protein AAFP08_15355 [Bacteroidota bacterium]
MKLGQKYPTAHLYPDKSANLVELRMVFNGGDADCNDGFWGAVWHRKSKVLVANLSSSGDTESTIVVVDKNLNKLVSYHIGQFPGFLLRCSDDPFKGLRMVYEDDSVLEKLIILAMKWCCVYGDQWSYKKYAF